MVRLKGPMVHWREWMVHLREVVLLHFVLASTLLKIHQPSLSCFVKLLELGQMLDLVESYGV
jgi:hypothetical protein